MSYVFSRDFVSTDRPKRGPLGALGQAADLHVLALGPAGLQLQGSHWLRRGTRHGYSLFGVPDLLDDYARSQRSPESHGSHGSYGSHESHRSHDVDDAQSCREIQLRQLRQKRVCLRDDDVIGVSDENARLMSLRLRLSVFSNFPNLSPTFVRRTSSEIIDQILSA